MKAEDVPAVAMLTRLEDRFRNLILEANAVNLDLGRMAPHLVDKSAYADARRELEETRDTLSAMSNDLREERARHAETKARLERFETEAAVPKVNGSAIALRDELLKTKAQLRQAAGMVAKMMGLLPGDNRDRGIRGGVVVPAWLIDEAREVAREMGPIGRAPEDVQKVVSADAIKMIENGTSYVVAPALRVVPHELTHDLAELALQAGKRSAVYYFVDAGRVHRLEAFDLEPERR